jgi:Cof subfamily protein (haloacid dehalogenase superfamily)
MGKFDGILICTDLDGTLYRNDKTVSDENREAIEYFKSEGGLFTFITGRMPNYSMDAYASAQPNVPFGCVNGGGVYDAVNGKYLWTHGGTNRESIELVRYVDEHFPTIGIQTVTFETTYFSKANPVNDWFIKVTGLPNIERHYEDVTEPIAKFIFAVCYEEEMAELKKALKNHPMSHLFDFVQSEKHLYEILPKGVDKGLGLRQLVNCLGCDMNKTVEVGDFDNDVGMLREARYGIAVANCSEKARKAADYVTVSNEEHALAKVIYDIESGVYKF